MKYDTHELSWAAGFFDGEGNVRHSFQKIGNGVGHSRLVVQIAQIDQRPLMRFEKAVGVGKVYGPYNQQSRVSKNQKPYWQFTSKNSANAQQIIAVMWPYLSEPKKEQAASALTSWRKFYVDNPTAVRIKGKKIMCPSGHDYDETNTYINRKGVRCCRTCHRFASAEWRKRAVA